MDPFNVVKLATEPSFRLRPGTLVNLKLLESPLQTRAELHSLREDLRRIELYTGNLVAADGQSTALLLGTPTGSNRTRLYEEVLARLPAPGAVPEDITVTGAPVAEALLGIHILEDLGVPRAPLGTSTRSHTERLEWKVPTSFYELRLRVARRLGLVLVAVLVMAGVFWCSLRKILAALLPLSVVGATLVFTFGLIGWLGVPIYLTTAVMPVLLTAMCVTDEIHHLFSRYFTLLRERSGMPHVELVQRALDELAAGEHVQLLCFGVIRFLGRRGVRDVGDMHKRARLGIDPLKRLPAVRGHVEVQLRVEHVVLAHARRRRGHGLEEAPVSGIADDDTVGIQRVPACRRDVLAVLRRQQASQNRRGLGVTITVDVYVTCSPQPFFA